MKYDEHRYDDIIHLSRPKSQKHLPMALEDRAAQFSPFAALTGHSDALRESARLTDERIELDEYEKVRISVQLSELLSRKDRARQVSLTYFVKDKKKNGGQYVTVAGILKRYDEISHQIVFVSGERIPLDDVIDIM